MTGTLRRIEPRYLRDQAFVELREAIVSGALAPGQPVVIDDLARSFGLSAMPVREAVKRLVADGLIEELPRRAHRVVPLTRASALHVIGIAETLIVRAYELGVPNLTAADVARMRTAFADAVACAAAQDHAGALAAVHAFHGVVYEASGNPEFARLIDVVAPRFDRVLRLWYAESITGVATTYRRDLLEALERGATDDAIAIVRRAWTSFAATVRARAPDRPQPG
jgi:DNA-binding GntR family transcriptional regulator